MEIIIIILLLIVIFKILTIGNTKKSAKPVKKKPQAKQSSKKILQALTKADTIVIDFETATAKRSSACAIGIVFIKDFEIISTHSQLIRPPENEYSKINISIHGISPKDTADAKTISEIWHDWLEKIITSEKQIAAHNARFDMSVLRESLKEQGIDTYYINAICTVDLAKELFPNLKNHKLKTVAKHLDVELDHHDPASDAKASAEIMIVWQKKHEKEIIKKREKERIEKDISRISDLLETNLKNAKKLEKESPKESARLYLDSIKKIRDVIDQYGDTFYLPRMPINRFSLLLEKTKNYENCVKLLTWYQNYNDPAGQTLKDQDSIEKRLIRVKKKLKKNVSK